MPFEVRFDFHLRHWTGVFQHADSGSAIDTGKQTEGCGGKAFVFFAKRVKIKKTVEPTWY